MEYKVHVEYHPLGVVIDDRHGWRELLIEGEDCCGKTFDQLREIANTDHEFYIDASTALRCKLKRL